ncbi:hypothetical protein DZA65_02824 [Dickeya dianthicola]|nr:hypothetical protein DZA65_02824 [Dickeya dianthicola]
MKIKLGFMLMMLEKRMDYLKWTSTQHNYLMRFVLILAYQMWN